MLPIDDRDWLEDFWIPLPEREIAAHADATGRAVKLEPRRPSTYAYRAEARLNDAAFALAVADCDRALDVCRDFAFAHLLRGRAYASLGNEQEAEESYREAIRVAPDHSLADETRRALSKLS